MEAGFNIFSNSQHSSPCWLYTFRLGLLAVVTGAVAMFAEKRRGSHTSAGSIYFWSLTALFATSTALATMRWSDDYHLFALAAVALVAVIVVREARRHRWRTQIDLHIVGMGISYIAMLTAFYVDNGRKLPIWRDMPILFIGSHRVPWESR